MTEIPRTTPDYTPITRALKEYLDKNGDSLERFIEDGRASLVSALVEGDWKAFNLLLK